MISEIEARMTVAQRLPASREMVEKSAAANASPNPMSASRNLTQISAEADCSHWESRPAGTDFSGLACAEATNFQPSTPGQNEQSGSNCRPSVRNREGLACSGWISCASSPRRSSREPALCFAGREPALSDPERCEGESNGDLPAN